MSALQQVPLDNTINNLVIAGASITNSPWFTWADFLQESTGLHCQNFSSKGSGNEHIVASLVKHQDKINKNSLVVVMFTNTDKFDWYVEGDKYFELQKEKHQPRPISQNSGFWCTGSWFPLDKSVYRELFYSHDYFCVKSVQQIMLLTQLCIAKQCKLLILFDSPIWKYSEESINNIGKMNLDPYKNFVKNELPYFDLWKKLLDPSLVNNDKDSLLGFCWNNNLPWYNKRMKGHPPSSSHYAFFKQVVEPKISDLLEIKNIDFLSNKIQKFDNMWNLTIE